MRESVGPRPLCDTCTDARDDPVASEAERLREQAARCLRLANTVPNEDVVQRLRGLAADYLDHAHTLERQEKTRIGP